MLPAAPGLMLGLWRRDGVKPRGLRAAGGGEIAFPVDNPAEVDATFAEWRGRGVKIALAPTQMDFGYSFVALDPDGQRLRVFAPAGLSAGDCGGGSGRRRSVRKVRKRGDIFPKAESCAMVPPDGFDPSPSRTPPSGALRREGRGNGSVALE